MKIAFVGKGGSGKTTISSLFARHIAAQDLPILALDADINQHLGTALGLSQAEAARVAPLGLEMARLKSYLRGTNPLIKNDAQMIKTTPPGAGSRLLTLEETNPIFEHFQHRVDGVRLMVTGPFDEADLGVNCYHSKVGAVELLLNHLIDGAGDYIVVDMTAGADAFASGLFTRFDVTFLVAEPTLKGITVYHQYQQYAKDFGVHLKVVGNKVESQDDIDFLGEHIGNDLLSWFETSSFIKSIEKGRHLPLSELESVNLEALYTLQQEVDKQSKDWPKFYRQAFDFHRKNALSWANEETGANLLDQIDPDFALPSR